MADREFTIVEREIVGVDCPRCLDAVDIVYVWETFHPKLLNPICMQIELMRCPQCAFMFLTPEQSKTVDEQIDSIIRQS